MGSYAIAKMDASKLSKDGFWSVTFIFIFLIQLPELFHSGYQFFCETQFNHSLLLSPLRELEGLLKKMP